MSTTHSEKMDQINRRIATLIESARRALSGESLFGVEQVREISAAIAGMNPILANKASELAQHPEIAAPLTVYKSQLVELQTILDQLTIMLVAQQDAMISNSSHVSSVSRWVNALEQTR